MVPSQEWSRNDHSLPSQTEIRPNSSGQNLKPYTWSSLDADWYPILANKLTPRAEKNEFSQDQTDLGTKSHHSPTRITIEDQIDGRGVFLAKDLGLYNLFQNLSLSNYIF